MDIKECPFCGGEARKSIIGEVSGAKYHAIVCRSCGSKTEGWMNVEKAVEAWNRRSPAEKELQRIVEELEKIPTSRVSLYRVMRIVKGEKQNVQHGLF